jgi:septum site-determining protein MinC
VDPVIHQQKPLRLVGRSYLAFVLTPEGTLSEWLAELDVRLARTPGLLSGRAVVLDLSTFTPAKDAIEQLVASLEHRGVGVMGFEGVEASALGSELPPLLSGQRYAPLQTTKAPSKRVRPQKLSPSLVLEQPVRSGQSIRFPEGDLIVLGSVGSGAEVLAGGSVHVYGALRGRAMAGSTGNQSARIFCQKLEAELLSIDGYYLSADDLDAQLRGRPVQARLDGATIMIRALN